MKWCISPHDMEFNDVAFQQSNDIMLNLLFYCELDYIPQFRVDKVECGVLICRKCTVLSRNKKYLSTRTYVISEVIFGFD